MRVTGAIWLGRVCAGSVIVGVRLVDVDVVIVIVGVRLVDVVG